MGISQSPEGRHCFARMTVRENLDLGAYRRRGASVTEDLDRVFALFPRLQERRKQFVKMVRHIAEEGRVAIRNVRRDVMHDLRELKDEGDVGADEEHRAETELQKLTNDKIAELDTLLKGKEEEILEV